MHKALLNTLCTEQTVHQVVQTILSTELVKIKQRGDHSTRALVPNALPCFEHIDS